MFGVSLSYFRKCQSVLQHAYTIVPPNNSVWDLQLLSTLAVVIIFNCSFSNRYAVISQCRFKLHGYNQVMVIFFPDILISEDNGSQAWCLSFPFPFCMYGSFVFQAGFSVWNTMEIIAGQGAFSFGSERPLAWGSSSHSNPGWRSWVLSFVRSFLFPVHIDI